MKDHLTQELVRLISGEKISTLLQPIVNIEKKTVFGYEALSRGPSDRALHGAQILFETAERSGLTSELEGVCLRTAARSWSGQGSPLKLFVNISPAKLMPSEFNPSLLNELLVSNGLKASDIVIELSERYPTADPTELLKTLSWLQTEGFLIAIDDLGSGYSGLKLWSELKPDFVKIDRHFIRDIQDDLIKREFLRSVVELANRLGCKLIAEGVETIAELRVVSDLGISLVQGFLLGRPKPIATASLDPLKSGLHMHSSPHATKLQAHYAAISNQSPSTKHFRMPANAFNVSPACSPCPWWKTEGLLACSTNGEFWKRSVRPMAGPCTKNPRLPRC